MVFFTAGVSHAQVAPVVDYGTYPPALPVGCPEGGAALINVRFTSATATSASLRTLPLVPGQSFTMLWDGFAPGCEGVGVGLSSKVATLATFDENADYWLYEFAYCGPEAGATPCAAGANSLTLRVPPLPDVPCYQLDAHLTPPLAQVGPDTGYYSATLNGVRNMLVSAQNGGSGDCSPLPPCATNPTLPAVAYLCVQTSTSSSTTPTSTPPSSTASTAPPPVATSASIVTSTVPGTPTSISTGPGLPITTVRAPDTTSNAQQLPATGTNTGALILTGLLLAFSGVCIVASYRRGGLSLPVS
ncbi:MAG: LPXTG cell wall anchor domain-containing protein [Acidimicrobiales bacterium]